MKDYKNFLFYLLVFTIFLGIISVNLFSDGMFMDGLIYATISRNLALGQGSFWLPHFSSCLLNNFFEHPPLALALQSIPFRIVGDSILVERFYSLSAISLVFFIVVRIWKKLTGEVNYGWLPLLILISVNEILWATSNNILENTMSIFVSASVLFYLKSLNKNRFIMLLFAGISISLGFLSKGFVGLYVLMFPVLYWIYFRNRSFYSTIFDSFLLLLFTVLPILTLMIFIPGAKHYLTIYFQNQVIGSIQHVQTVDSRFEILKDFLQNVVFGLAVLLAVIIFFRKNLKNERHFSEYQKWFYLFNSIVAMGVFPIMISLKQSGFYILTVYPFFSIGVSILIFPAIKNAVESINLRSLSFKIFNYSVYLLVGLSIIITAFQFNRLGRDKEMILFVKEALTITGNNAVVGINPDLYPIWNLHGYFARYGNVSLCSGLSNEYDFYITNTSEESSYDRIKYKRETLNTYDLVLLSTSSE